MKNIEICHDEVITKLNNKDTFILALTATWCPPCNKIKYGIDWPTENDIKTEKGLLQGNLVKGMFMFCEHVEGKDITEVTSEDRNFALVPLVKAIEATTGIKHREMTFRFNEDGSTTLEPNMHSYRPPVPSFMIVKEGKVSGFYVYPQTQENMDLIINAIK